MRGEGGVVGGRWRNTWYADGTRMGRGTAFWDGPGAERTSRGLSTSRQRTLRQEGEVLKGMSVTAYLARARRRHTQARRALFWPAMAMRMNEDDSDGDNRVDFATNQLLPRKQGQGGEPEDIFAPAESASTARAAGLVHDRLRKALGCSAMTRTQHTEVG